MPDVTATPDPARRVADERLADEWEREYFGDLRNSMANAGRAWPRAAFLAGLARGRESERRRISAVLWMYARSLGRRTKGWAALATLSWWVVEGTTVEELAARAAATGATDGDE